MSETSQNPTPPMFQQGTGESEADELTRLRQESAERAQRDADDAAQRDADDAAAAEAAKEPEPLTVGDFDGDVRAFNERDSDTDDDGNPVATFRSATGHNDDDPEES